MYILLLAMLTLSTSSGPEDVVVLGDNSSQGLQANDVMVDTVAINDTIHDTILVPTPEHVKLEREVMNGSQTKNLVKSSEKAASKPNVKGTILASDDMMNILYANYDNPVTMSIPGNLSSQISLLISNGSVRRISTNKAIIHPETTEETELSVYNGKNNLVTRQVFKVRQLPPPSAYILMENGQRKYSGAIPRKDILSATKVAAAIDDGTLDVTFDVVSFETVYFDSMGNGIMMLSYGNRFSERQLQAIRHLPHNRRLYLTKVHVLNPDGKERILDKTTELIVK